METTGHLSGACTFFLPERIARHNKLCAGLQQAAVSVGLGITVEPTIKAPTVVWDGEMARLDAASNLA